MDWPVLRRLARMGMGMGTVIRFRFTDMAMATDTPQSPLLTEPATSST